jgi:hypothetical protein
MRPALAIDRFSWIRPASVDFGIDLGLCMGLGGDGTFF